MQPFSVESGTNFQLEPAAKELRVFQVVFATLTERTMSETDSYITDPKEDPKLSSLEWCIQHYVVCNDSNSTTHCADKLPPRGRTQIQIHTDSYWIIDFLRL